MTTTASPSEDRAMNALAAGRILLGVAALASPAGLVGLFGMRTSPELNYMTRIFGARAIALGTGYLTEPPEHRSRWHRLALGVDTSDTLTAAAHLVRRDVPRPAAGALFALTGGYAAVGLHRLLAQRRA
jgi:hypothetical protein